MFDSVTMAAIRLRRRRVPPTVVEREPAHRTSLVCAVCEREIRPEEEFFWVDKEVHCFQCHSMLDYELQKDRECETEVKEKGTRWECKDEE